MATIKLIQHLDQFRRGVSSRSCDGNTVVPSRKVIVEVPEVRDGGPLPRIYHEKIWFDSYAELRQFLKDGPMDASSMKMIGSDEISHLLQALDKSDEDHKTKYDVSCLEEGRLLPPFELLRLMVYQDSNVYEYLCFVDQMYITDVHGNTVDHVALGTYSAIHGE